MKQRAATPEEDWARGLVVEGPITKIEHSRKHWSITFEDGWTVGCSDERMGDNIPEIGDVWTTFGTFGYSFHGLALNRKVLWYLTPEEEEEARRAEIAKMDDDKRQAFEKEREKLDAEYDALPDAFKRRIDRFREHNPDFRWEFEGYEMGACVDAVKIADYVKDPEKIKEFYDAPWDEQKLAGISDAHSGNSFGCACNLAMHYLIDPERVVQIHGAMTALVGCEKYGCWHEGMAS